MHVIALVMSFSSNLTSHLIKSPKIYFTDTGLACRLQGWTSATPILTAPQLPKMLSSFRKLKKYLVLKYRILLSVLKKVTRFSIKIFPWLCLRIFYISTHTKSNLFRFKLKFYYYTLGMSYFIAWVFCG